MIYSVSAQGAIHTNAVKVAIKEELDLSKFTFFKTREGDRVKLSLVPNEEVEDFIKRAKIGTKRLSIPKRSIEILNAVVKLEDQAVYKLPRSEAGAAIAKFIQSEYSDEYRLAILIDSLGNRIEIAGAKDLEGNTVAELVKFYYGFEAVGVRPYVAKRL